MSISKRLDEARRAFGAGDLSASAAAHTPDRITAAAEEKHGVAGSQYIGDLVYGGLDGIITTFAVVSGVAGAGASLGQCVERCTTENRSWQTQAVGGSRV